MKSYSKFNKIIYGSLILVLICLSISGCGGQNQESSGNNDGLQKDTKAKIIRMTVSGTPEIDPAATVHLGSTIALVNIYDTLVFPSLNGEGPEPLLATNWECSEDGQEYIFYLKQGVKFHNGDELKASDIVFSTNRLLTMGEGFAYLYLDVIEDVIAIDDYTVKFILKKPYGPFVDTLHRLYILNEKQVMENIDPNGPYGDFGDYGRNWLLANDAGSGPYTVKELVQQSHIYATKFDEWHGGDWDSNAPDAFKMIDNCEPTTVRTMMANRELEITDMWQPSENITAMSKLPGVKIAMYSQLAAQHMYYNTKKAPTDDINFRKAISYLFDYDMIIKNIFPGSPQSYGPVPAFVNGHVKTNQYNFDIEKSKEYLSKSKYFDVLDDYPVEILCISDVPDQEKVALAFQAAAKQIGISVKIDKAPWISVVERLSTIETTPNLVSINMYPQFNEAGSMLESRYSSKTCGTFENGEWLLDEELDAMIEESLTTINKEERFEKYAEIQNIIVDDICPSAWLADTLDRVAYQSDYIYWPIAEESEKGNCVSGVYGYHYYFYDMRIYPEDK